LRYSETLALLASWLVISFCFSVAFIFESPDIFPIAFGLSAASAGVGFLLHELAHRTTARRYGCNAYYRIWLAGIALALAVAIFTRGALVFAALGAVYISPMISSASLSTESLRKVYGVISLAGPSMNLLLAALFLALSLSGLGGWLSVFSTYALRINLWLAAFNLLPIPPFDGSKVMAWSKMVWAAFAVPAWALTLLI